MNISLPRVRRIALIALGVAITALIVALYFANRDSAQATHSPANKVWVAADTVEIMHSQNTPGASEDPDHVILTETEAKYSNPTDLRLSVTAECALWTNTAVSGDDDAETKARVELWVTIDGKTVPVTTDESVPDPDPDNSGGPLPVGPTGAPLTGPTDPDQQGAEGHVVFCNRATRMKTENISDDSTDNNDVIRSYNRTRSANAFNWAAMNVGENYDANNDNRLKIQVHARLATQIIDAKPVDNFNDPPAALPANPTDSPAAKAAVGKRTLFIEPVKMANHATF